MCQYSAEDGHLTDYHLVHLSSFGFKGASLTIIEATSVLPNGGITPQDAGLWKDSQIAPIKRISTFFHVRCLNLLGTSRFPLSVGKSANNHLQSQGQKLGIQLAHAGRKASTSAPWTVQERGQTITATKDVGGWPDDVMGPSAIKWGEGYPEPREMSAQDIVDVITGFRDSARRAVEAGIDVIEIHAAHGYLLSSFLSPLSNTRTDSYGGSFENRIRILIEIIKVIREVVPKGMPLLVRVSGTEWMEELEKDSWDVPSTIKLAKLLPALGVDLLDVSSGGNNERQHLSPFNDRQISIAGQIRSALYEAGIKDLLIGAVGMITEAEQAKEVLEKTVGEGVEIQDEQGSLAKADVVLVARQFLREPEWVTRVAYRLGVKIKWPVQYERAQFLRGSKI